MSAGQRADMPALVIPADAAVNHVAIVGKVGSGKTYLAKGMVEHLLAHQRRACILDPTGVWWGLRSSASGKEPGFPVAVFGGEHADVPLQPTAAAGKALAAIVAERNFPVVIDLSEMMIGERHTFATAFAEGIYAANRLPLHLIIDEADEFCPQRPLPETRRLLHHYDRIVRRGRARGFRVMLISQRPAVLNKNVLTQVETLVAMRLTGPQDRAAVMDWINGQADPVEGKKVLASLSGLQKGEAWIWYPEGGVLSRVKAPTIRTFDSSQTPGDGSPVPAPTKLADVDLSGIDLADVEDEDDAEVLAERVRELEHALKAYRDQDMSPADRQRLRSEAFGEGHTAGYRSGYETALIAAGESLKRLTPPPPSATELNLPALRPPPGRPVAPVLQRHNGAERQPGRGGEPGLRRMMIALAQRPHGVSAKQLGLLAGMSSTSGTFATYLGKLRGEGLAEGARDLIRITPAGRKWLGDYQPLPTGKALLEYWCIELGATSGVARLLRAVAHAYPKGITKAAAADAAQLSPTSGTFATYLGKLRTLQLVQGKGELRASGELFGG